MFSYGYIDIDREVVGCIGDLTTVYAFANVSLHDSDFRSSFPQEDVVDADEVIRLVRIIEGGHISPGDDLPFLCKFFHLLGVRSGVHISAEDHRLALFRIFSLDLVGNKLSVNGEVVFFQVRAQ